MAEWIEEITKLFLKEVYGEGQRFIKAKALSAAITAMRAVRRALILHYLAMVTCFTVGLSLFASAYQIFNLLHDTGRVTLTAPLIFTLAAFVVSSLALWLTIREKTWLQASGLGQRIEEMNEQAAWAAEQRSAGIDEERLAIIIEQIIEKKFADMKHADSGGQKVPPEGTPPDGSEKAAS
jgi:hypothetical protein